MVPLDDAIFAVFGALGAREAPQTTADARSILFRGAPEPGLSLEVQVHQREGAAAVALEARAQRPGSGALDAFAVVPREEGWWQLAAGPGQRRAVAFSTSPSGGYLSPLRDDVLAMLSWLPGFLATDDLGARALLAEESQLTVGQPPWGERLSGPGTARKGFVGAVRRSVEGCVGLDTATFLPGRVEEALEVVGRFESRGRGEAVSVHCTVDLLAFDVPEHDPADPAMPWSGPGKALALVPSEWVLVSVEGLDPAVLASARLLSLERPGCGGAWLTRRQVSDGELTSLLDGLMPTLEGLRTGPYR